MKKIIVATIATVLISSIALKATANEEAHVTNAQVEMFQLSSEQAGKISEERVRYQSIVDMLTVLDDREASQILALTVREYERRIDSILNVE